MWEVSRFSPKDKLFPSSLGEDNLIFCCSVSSENHFGFGGRQNNNNHHKCQGKVKNKKMSIIEVTYESDHIF